jgi:RNA polymerase-binding transcription factor DksA
MDAEKLTVFKSRLEKEKSRLEKELTYVDSTMATSQSEWSGEGQYENHMADLGSATFSRESDLSLSIGLHGLMAKVSAALVRIEDGSFGICTYCGRPIEPNRLDAIPYAEYCIEDQIKEEKSW